MSSEALLHKGRIQSHFQCLINKFSAVTTLWCNMSQPKKICFGSALAFQFKRKNSIPSSVVPCPAVLSSSFSVRAIWLRSPPSWTSSWIVSTSVICLKEWSQSFSAIAVKASLFFLFASLKRFGAMSFRHSPSSQLSFQKKISFHPQSGSCYKLETTGCLDHCKVVPSCPMAWIGPASASKATSISKTMKIFPNQGFPILPFP